MWYAFKRLSLGLSLIALASVLLLYSDRTHRLRAQKRATQAAKSQMAEVAVFQNSSNPTADDGVAGILGGLRESGFIEGENLEVRKFNAEGDTGTMNAIARDITTGDYDLIMTVTTPALLAVVNANKQTQIPHVFALVTDPFAVGLGIDQENPLNHPKHLVGYGTMQPVEQSFQAAKECFPALKTVGVVWNPGERNSEIVVTKAREICPRYGITLLEAPAEKSADIGEAARSLTARGVEAIWTGADTSVLVALDQVLAAARDAKIPVFSVVPPQAEKGALFDLGADYREVGRLTGHLGARILKGTDPATIPVENILPEQLILNKKALNGLEANWRFPDSLLKQANVIIDEKGTHVVRERQLRRPPPGRLFHVAILYFGPDPGTDNCIKGLVDGLRELGFEEGRNLDLRMQHAQGEIANIAPLMQNLDSQDIDLIIPMSTPCVTAAASLIKSKPVVFTYCYDPIAAGVGKSFTNHLPHMTGIGSFPPIDETTSMVKSLLPDLTVMGTMYNPSEANSRKVVSVGREKFTARGIKLEEVPINSSNDALQAVQALASRAVQAIWLPGDNTAYQAIDIIVKTATDAKIPIINNDIEFIDKGILASAGVGFYHSGHAAAKPVARVLLGESPKDIPIENVTESRIEVNEKVAQALGVPVPPELKKTKSASVDTPNIPPERGTPNVLSSESRLQAESSDLETTQVAAVSPARPKKTWKLNLIEYMQVVDSEEAERGVLEGLRMSGLKEGKEYTVTIRNAHGDMPTLSTMVDLAVTEGADMLITLSTPAFQAALNRGGKLPIVCTYIANPVAAGGGKSYTDHLPNVTGTYTLGGYEQMLPIIRRFVPDLKRVGTVFVPSEVNNVVHKEKLTEVANSMGIEVEAVPASTATEVADAALALVGKDIDAVCQISGNLTAAGFSSIAQAAYKAKLPLFGFMTQQATDGAAVVLSTDFYDAGLDAGVMAARIMRGESPKDIPFKLNSTFKLIINKPAAEKCGMTIPQDMIKDADQVIE